MTQTGETMTLEYESYHLSDEYEPYKRDPFKLTAAEEEQTSDASESPELASFEHTVEILDLDNLRLGSTRQKYPFDLEKERGKTSRSKKYKSKTYDVLSASTILRMSSKSYTFKQFKNFQFLDIIRSPAFAGYIASIKITIGSVPFLKALKAVVSYEVGDSLDGIRLELYEPYPIVSHHLDELQTYIQAAEKQLVETPQTSDTTITQSNHTSSRQMDAEDLADVKLVFEFVDSALRDPISQEMARYQQDPPVCSFRMLWLLFRPGCMVYVKRTQGVRDACIVESVDTGNCGLTCPFEYLQPCILALRCIGYDGRQHLTPVKEELVLFPFHGERSILTLQVVPCEMHDKTDGGELRRQLTVRGKKWVDHLAGKQVEYQDPENPNIKGRAYIDCTTTRDVTPEWDEGAGNVSDFDDLTQNRTNRTRLWVLQQNKMPQGQPLKILGKVIAVRDIEQLVAHDPACKDLYIICHRDLRGFMFSTRTWEIVDVRYCNAYKPDRNPLSKLVMPEDQKTMIKALVYKFTDPRFAGGNPQQVWGADFIKQKGDGQIFLLHGGPGVGKTFTAECIAEFTGRPLLALTCGDVGTSEVEMETKLRDWLKLAHKWGAIMLIDEADVFLEKRMDADLKRNSLVTVFLREIEYYQGILFLTTNRVGRFDDAFISRIHVVIHYRDLSPEYRRKIWNQFFDKLEAERGDYMRIDNSARRYVLENHRITDVQWNGREIRNAFQTAVALAEYRFITKPPMEKADGEIAMLEEKDFEQICEMTIQFKEYLKEVNDGLDEHARAEQDRVRVVEGGKRQRTTFI